jgi:hypothetical protein
MSDRFDKLAKGLATGLSRRRFLKMVAGGTVATVAAVVPEKKDTEAFFGGYPGPEVNQTFDPFPNQGSPMWGMPGHYQPGPQWTLPLGGFPVYVPGNSKKSRRER